MPTFLEISRHSPENCPIYNEKVRKIMMEGFDKLEGLLKKHRVKMVGGWAVTTEHLMIMVYDAPSLEAFEKLGMEWEEITGAGAYFTCEIKLAYSLEEAMKMIKQAR
ncbi:MAG: hypothetical protein H3Z50_03490 [archaeon]|nr:hypothetical protein [archaeon]MCP8306631.1 hypothetical protein [archaeon]